MDSGLEPPRKESPMKLPGYYSSGQFAKMANVSVRTIRFYDKQNILKPSYVTDAGARFYTDADFARLQQILLLKYLGFSLDDIREMTINDLDCHFMLHSLNMQKKLIQDRIEQLQMVENAIGNTIHAMKEDQQINWSQMLDLIHLTNVEKSLKTQYQDATNISARIRLHHDYSTNPEGWFPWLYRQAPIEKGMRILEVGCGNGALWYENKKRIPQNLELVLSDISDGMLRDARRNIGASDSRFSYTVFDCHEIPFPEESFDLVFANHVLFYCDDLPRVFREIRRILRPNGLFLCSTYGKHHMQEISSLVQEFDNRIVLSADKLYENFGLENGAELLKPYFSSVQCRLYDDSIHLDRPEPLIEYILSCHGNQNQFLLDRYHEFRIFAERRVQQQFHITKEAGIFLCRK